MAQMKGLILALLLSAPARAERADGGGAPAALSAAYGDAIYVALALPAGVNGQVALRRLAPDGGVLWETRWGRGRGEEPLAIATSPEGGAVVVGAHARGCFGVKFDAPGRVAWETDLPAGSGQCRPAAVVADGAGATYALGTVSGSDGFDAMAWKLDRGGSRLWSYRYDRPGAVYAQNLYLDPRGDRLHAFVQLSLNGRFSSEFFKLDLDGRRIEP